MKIRKNISKLLGLSLFMSNFSLYSTMATSNNEIPNRYETLEGEYITINDSTEGELHEIEIFGNTIQDENNLQDIQSVGDLYVDENNNPILDKQGREQYKIDIVSNNKNLFNEKNIVSKNHSVYRNITFDKKIIVSNLMKYTYLNEVIGSIVLNKGIYTWSTTNVEYDISTYTLFELVNSDYNGICIAPSGTKKVTFEVFEDNTLFDIRVDTGWNHTVDTPSEISFNIQLEKGSSASEYTPYKDNKITILLPCQLQKVGDIADRLYWDNSKGKYVVEKKVNSFIIDGTEPVRIAETTNNGYIVAQFTKNLSNFIAGNNLDSVNNMAIKNTSGDNIYTGIYDGVREAFYIKDDFVRIKILKSRLTEEGLTEDLEGISKYFNKHNFISYMITNIKIIETNITYKLIIPTYDNKTHIFSQTENGVNATLKVTVDRLNKMALDATTEAENNPTIYNLNSTRNIVNQMDEGELKEQLQQRLNQISNLNDLQLERKTSTSNVDIYIKSENMLSLSLSNNSISFTVSIKLILSIRNAE